jgi:chaperone modulatory protein CbpM
MENKRINSISGVILENEHQFTLAEICQSSCLPAEHILKMVEQGILEPVNIQSIASRWQFQGNSLIRVRTVVRLQQDLGVNLAGAALALELLDEIKSLRKQLVC